MRVDGWEATVRLAAMQNPRDWTWDECVACGSSEPTTRGIHLLTTDGTLGRTAWCSAPACVEDRKNSTSFVLPETAQKPSSTTGDDRG